MGCVKLHTIRILQGRKFATPAVTRKRYILEIHIVGQDPVWLLMLLLLEPVIDLGQECELQGTCADNSHAP